MSLVSVSTRQARDDLNITHNVGGAQVWNCLSCFSQKEWITARRSSSIGCHHWTSCELAPISEMAQPRQEMGYRVIMKYLKKNDTNFTEIVTTGRFTVQDGDISKEIIIDIKANATKNYVIDVSKLEFMDSSAIGMLLIINGEATKLGKTLSVIVGDSLVRRLIESTQLKLIIPIYDSREAYVATVSAS
ncbi:MAG: STAS domain-containing protein [Azospirillaceae bacterium]|nr:STAS domain-containing protein [Azospirillaceae bacterium]